MLTKPPLDPTTQHVVDEGDAATALAALGTIIKALQKAPLSVEALPEHLKQLKPKPRHISALLKLAGCPGMSVGDLAERLQVSLASASQVVTDLVDQGLVSRFEDPTDRRRTLVEVNDEHRPLVTAILKHRVQPLQAALLRLDPAERAGLTRGLQRLADELHTTTTSNEGTS